MHFFCELTDLPNEAEAFGPVLSNGTLEEKFNIASKFTLTSEVKAFACQTGMMIVHQSTNPNLVNVIIKPSKTHSISFSPVKYYIYRGLTKSSFIDGTVITPVDLLTNSDFVSRFWNGWNLVSPPPVTPPGPSLFGYDTSLASNLNVENIFNNDQANVRAIYIKEGEWLGSFATTSPNEYASFEIIIDTDHLNLEYEPATNSLKPNRCDLDYLSRAADYFVDISGMPDASDSEKFNIRLKREEVLSFIDPCAFFGMHAKGGLDISNYTSGLKSTDKKKSDDLYNDVLSIFLNKNKVYVDIRNENGYSYDFYQNYDDLNTGLILQFALDNGATTEHSYYIDGWPLFFYDTTAPGNTFFKKIEIQLKRSDNTEPLLFIENGKIKSKLLNKSQFEDKLTPNNLADIYTKAVGFRPYKTGGASFSNISHWLKLQYLRQDGSTASATVPTFSNFLDNIFASIDLAYEDGSNTVFQKNTSSKYNQIFDDDFKLISKPSVFEANNLICLLSQKALAHKQSKNDYPKIEGNKANAKDVHQAKIFPKNAVFSVVVLREGTDTIRVTELAAYNQSSKSTKQEDLFMLFLTKAELDQLIALADSENINELHKRSVVFSNFSSEKDDGNIPYKKYELKIQGLDNNGNPHISAASGIFVYSFSDKVFTSKDAGDINSIPDGLPDAGTMTEFPFASEFSYDSSELQLNGLHSTGFEKVFFNATKISSELIGAIYYPSNTKKGPLPSGTFPVVVIVHGNGHFYYQYEKLCKHLAKNGFIVSSISCLAGRGTTDWDLVPKAAIPVPAILTDMTTANPDMDHIFQVPFDGALAFYDSVNNKVFRIITDVSSGAVIGSEEIRILRGSTFIPAGGGSPPKVKLNTDSFRQGMEDRGRAELLYAHIKILIGKFPGQYENSLGILGHSRGGEAVVRAANEILDPANTTIYQDLVNDNLENLKAVISLSPTDQFPEITKSGSTIASVTRKTLDKDVPYFVIYGSRDYDVDGRFKTNNTVTVTDPDLGLNDKLFMQTGFSIFDRATGQEKSMAFVKGATHNGFITSNVPDQRKGVGKSLISSPFKEMISVSKQKNFIMAYVNAFFRKNLKSNEDFWLPYFTGNFVPPSVGNTEIEFQYERKDQKIIVDDMESEPDWERSSSLKYVKLNGIDTQGSDIIDQGNLRKLDSDLKSEISSAGTSPHFTDGIRIYSSSNDKLAFELPTNDISTYGYLSFRIANTSRVAKIEGLNAGLKDNSGTEKYYEVKALNPVDVRTDGFKLVGGNEINEDPTKTAMQTIRIPLSNYQSQGIDLSNCLELIIKFPDKAAGKVFIDNILITN